jgi:hypothetical protein
VSHSHRIQALGWALTALAALLLAGTAVLLGLNAGRMGTNQLVASAILSLVVVVYAGVGRLITSRRPGNAIAWLLGLIGVSIAISTFAEQYALYGLATSRGPVPGARIIGCLAGPAAELTILLALTLILLYPDGRLPSRRWRPVAWAIAVVTVA